MVRLMTDHIGRFAQEGAYLSANKERIEREGKHCSNCTRCKGPEGKDSTEDVCKDWENYALPKLSEIVC